MKTRKTLVILLVMLFVVGVSSFAECWESTDYWPMEEGYWIEYDQFDILDCDVNLNVDADHPGYLYIYIQSVEFRQRLTMYQTIDAPLGFPHPIVTETYYNDNDEIEGALRQSYSEVNGVGYFGEKFGWGGQEYNPCDAKLVVGPTEGECLRSINQKIVKRTPDGRCSVQDNPHGFIYKTIIHRATWHGIEDVWRTGLVEVHPNGDLLQNCYNYFFARGIGKVCLIQVKIEKVGGHYEVREDENGVKGMMLWVKGWGREE